MQDERKTKGQLITEMGELRQRLILLEQEQQKLKQSIVERQRAENIMHARLRLLKFAESHSLEEFTQATLDELETLTASTMGFYHLVEADQRTLTLQTWSTNTLQHMCNAEGKGQHYDLAEAGVWVDCVHQRQPVIHNNYEALANRKGMPRGHAPLVRELVVPIFRANKIVAIIGVGNKSSDYDESDVEIVSLLGDLSWDITERQRAEEELRQALQEAEKSRKEAEALLRASRAVMTQHTFADAAWEIFESCRETIGAPAGYVSLLSDTGDNNEVVFLESGGLPCTVDPDLPMPIRGLRAESYRTGEVVYDNDFARNKYVKFLPDGHLALGNVLFAPMVHEAKVVGLLGLSNKSGGFTPYDARLAAGFASLAAIALLSRRGEETLRQINEELEQRVLERTVELRRTVEQLQWEIKKRQRVEETLRESEQRLRYLTSQILTAQEQERQRIARDLHDEMGQSLMALKMQLNSFKRRVKGGQEAWVEFDQAIDFVDVITDQAREICQSLRPSALENLGLNGALRELLSEFQKHHGLEVIDEIADLSGLFSNEAQITVYRLFQECMTNAVRHGKATCVTVCSQKGDGTVRFSCEDNGAGFDLKEVRSQRRPGMGLAAMEERVRLLQGIFEITSAKGQGTRIEIILPAAKV